MLAATCLAERGIEVEVVDSEWERQRRGYACGLHPQSLRMLDELGLTDIMSLGQRIDRLHVHRGRERVGTVDLTRLGGPFPHMLTLPQSDLEEALVAQLEQRGVPILWRHEMTEMRLQDDCVEATVLPKQMQSQGTAESREEVLTPDARIIRTSFVVGADGFDSGCRAATGINTIDLESSEAYAIFEFDADMEAIQHDGLIILENDLVSAFYPLGPSHGRWMFQLWQGLDEPPTKDGLEALISERAPWFSPRVERLSWSTISRFEHVIADEFGSGRIWLAGDAAHLTAPVGFQSMNVGLSEAYELSMAVGGVLRHEATPRTFERFAQARYAEWARLLGIQNKIVGGELLSDAEGARLVPCMPASGRDLDELLSQLGLTFDKP